MIEKKPKYLIVTEWIKEKICKDNLNTGDKFYTEKELSKIFNVSRQTIRQALNILHQENILESRQGSGTYLSDRKLLQQKKLRKVGVIITYFDDYIFPSIIKGIDSILSANDYIMQLACTQNNIENEARALESMLISGIDGLIIEPTKSALPNINKKIYEEIIKTKIPTLLINAYYEELDFPYIALDDFNAGKIAISHLVEQGHKKIAMILKSDDLQGHLRYSGAVTELKRLGLESLSENIFWFTTEDVDYIKEEFVRLRRYIRDCSAILCYNDKIASIIINMLSEHNLSVPEDISVISIDNSELASIGKVPLTSVNHPKEQLGRQAGENIIKLINNNKFDANKIYEAQLIKRNSVKKLI